METMGNGFSNVNLRIKVLPGKVEYLDQYALTHSAQKLCQAEIISTGWILCVYCFGNEAWKTQFISGLKDRFGVGVEIVK